MAFTLPTFNLTCNIKKPPTNFGFGIPSAPYRVTGATCNLAWGKRVQAPQGVSRTGDQANFGISMILLLPKLTDIRGPQDTVSWDMVEVPAGSGRWYVCLGVDDIGKGFTNEHRGAVLHAVFSAWVAPYA